MQKQRKEFQSHDQTYKEEHVFDRKGSQLTLGVALQN